MFDTKARRSGYIAISESDKETTHNRRVDIEVVGTLPILAGEFVDRFTKVGVSPIDGTIEVQESVSPDIGSVLNILVDHTTDENGTLIKLNRYKYLGNAISTQYSGLRVDFYYDNDFKDIIVIPELKTFGVEDNVLFYSNDKRTIRGYSIGNGRSMNNAPATATYLPLIDDDTDSIPEPARFIKTKTYTVTCYGLEVNSICNSISRNQSGTENYSEKGAPLQFVEFDLNDILFGADNKVTLNTYNLLQQYHAELKVDYVGKRKIHKIVIPINF